MPAYDLWGGGRGDREVVWDQEVVQLGHHSYGPTRCRPACGPNTRPSDDLRIERAVPSTVVRADRRYVDAESAPAVVFPAPGSDSAQLRFAALGRNVEYSLDGGAHWLPARL
jgi:hypothetical protein